MAPSLENLRVLVLDALFPRRKALRALHARWGQAASGDGWLAGEYFDLIRDARDPACVDDKTWADLEFPRIFADMDATASPVGSQVLLRQLRTYVEDPDALARKYGAYAELRAHAAAREEMQAALLPLQDAQHARIAGFICGDLPPPLRHQG